MLQEIHFTITHSPHMHVMNVVLKQLKNRGFKSHTAAKHDGLRFRCEKCDYQSASKPSLKLRTQSKHDGIRYVCGGCGFKATQKHFLKSHIMTAKHGRE